VSNAVLPHRRITAGTTGLVAQQLGRNAILIELNEQYAELARQRIQTNLS